MQYQIRLCFFITYFSGLCCTMFSSLIAPPALMLATSMKNSSAIAIHKIVNCADLVDHFQACTFRQFSGQLNIGHFDDPQPMWSFSFYLGHLFWSTGWHHPARRWHRQLLQYCPELENKQIVQSAILAHGWKDEFPACLAKQGDIPQGNLSAMIVGHTLELLFDFIQTEHQSQPAPLQLTYCPLTSDVSHPELLTCLQIDRVWQRAEQVWSVWQRWGLDSISPNLAPVILDDDELRQQTSLLTYQNLSTLINGYWTLRDLAVKLKQPIVPLTRSLMPYVKQSVMGLETVGDIRLSERPAHRFSIAYIEDSRFDSAAMSQILNQAGYEFVSIADPLQAIPILLENKPDLIFLDLLMPIANGYEICTQIRRVTALQETPIVILTSSAGIVDRVRAKLVGASGFLSKPIDPNKVLDTLQQHLQRDVDSSLERNPQ